MPSVIACFMNVAFDEHITKITVNGEDYTTSPVEAVHFGSAGTPIKLYFADGYEYNDTSISFSPDTEEYTYPTQSWDASTQTLTIKGYSDGSGTVTITSKIPTVKQTIDVSTLTGWANLATGNHQITVKTKASGYADSAASNAVTVSKAASGYTVTFDDQESGGATGTAYYSLDDGATWTQFCEIVSDADNDVDPTSLTNITSIKFKIVVNDLGLPPFGVKLVCSAIGMSLGGKNTGTFTSDNYTLTEDITVIITT